MKPHRCDECGKYRVNVTVVNGRDLCPSCVPPVSRSLTADRKHNPKHRDPLMRDG